MSFLYLPKQAPAAGQRGIRCGKTYLPLPDRTVTESVLITDGLEVYADGSSTAANVGTIVCSDSVQISGGALQTNTLTDETTGSIQIIGGTAVENTTSANDFNGTLCLAVNLSGSLGCLIGKSPDSGITAFSLLFKVSSSGNSAAAGSVTTYEIYGPSSYGSSTNTVSGSVQYTVLDRPAYLFLRASKTESDKFEVYFTSNPDNLNKVGTIYKTYLFQAVQHGEEYRYTTTIGSNIQVGSSGMILAKAIRLYNRRISDAEMRNLVCELNAPEQFTDTLIFTKTTPEIGKKGLVIDLPEEEMPTSGLVFNASFGSDTHTAETGQTMTFGTSGIKFGTYSNIPSISMTRGGSLISFPADDLPTSNNPFTISVWFSNPSNDGQESIIIWGPESSGQMLFLCFNEGQLRLDTWFGGTSFEVENLFSADLQLLDVVYDGTTLKAYINAILVGSADVTLATGTATTAYIGGHPEHEFGWSGYLADLRIYNRALSESELKTLLHRFKKRKLFLPLEESAGVPEANASGILLNSKYAIKNENYSQNQNIPKTDSVVFYASGNSLKVAESGQAFTMSGSGVTQTSYMGIPSLRFSSSSRLSFPDTGLPSGGSAYTISLWAKADQSCNSESVLFMWGNLNGNGIALAYCSGSAVRDVGGNGNDHSTSSNVIDHTELNHLALSYDGSVSKIYVNGELVSTKTINRSLTLQEGTIGATHSWGEYFTGFISSIRVYNETLTDSEIAELAQEWTLQPATNRIFIPILTPSILSRLRSIVAGNQGKTYTTELSAFGSLDSSATWIGGVLAENGKIYGIPHGAAEILIIDTATDTVTTIPTEAGDLKWFGGCLAPNGKIYAIPHTSSKVLVIDPETDTTYTFTTISGDRKWAGGVLGPDGKIYCLPCQEYRIGVIDPETDTLETFGNVELNISWSWKWIGGVLGPDNCIYAFPSNYQNKYVLKIDPVARTTQLIEHGISASGELFQGSVFAPDGQLWGVTCYYDKLVSYSTDTGTVTIHGDVRSGNGKWVGGCLAPNGKLYFAPLNSGSILEVDPDTGSSVEIPIDTALESGNKFRGCVLAPNGSIYFIPYNATSALKLSFTGGLTPFPKDVCESPWLNKF